jgi:asparagine N-glycosylation enzyme membrane subunit Stt3
VRDEEWASGRFAVSRYGAAITVAAMTGIALAVRLAIAPPEGALVDVDADLHLRRAEAVLAHGYAALGGIDHMIAWPDGAHVNWPPGFDLFLAGLAALTKPGWLDTVCGISIAVLGALAIPVAYALARTALPRLQALISAGIVAVLPAHIELTRVGRVDHHVVEPTLLWGALALLVAGARRRSRSLAVAAGLVVALAFALSPTALVIAVVVGAAALWLGRLDARAPLAMLGAAAAGSLALAAATRGLRLFTLDEPSAAQPILFAVAWGLFAACAAAPAGPYRLRRLIGGALVLSAAGLAAGARSGTLAFAAKQGLIGTIVESRGLFAFGWTAALAPLGAVGLAAPLAAAVAWHRGARLPSSRDPARQILHGSAVVLLAITVLQRRFMHLAALPVAAGLVDAVSCIRWTRARAVAGLAACGLGAIAPVRYLFATPEWNPRTRAVRDVAELLRALPPGGVLSQWPNGHIIARVGGHPVVASPLLTAATMTAVEQATRILLDDNDARAQAAMDRRRVRYLVATAVPPTAVQRYLDALGDRRPAAVVERGALVTRLLKRDGEGVPGVRELASSVDQRAKLFERVVGVDVVGRARPGSDVTATVDLVAPWRATFAVRVRARADAGGRFQLRLPYPTRGEPVIPGLVRAVGPWRVARDDQMREVALDEADVTAGRTIDLD